MVMMMMMMMMMMMTNNGDIIESDANSDYDAISGYAAIHNEVIRIRVVNDRRMWRKVDIISLSRE